MSDEKRGPVLIAPPYRHHIKVFCPAEVALRVVLHMSRSTRKPTVWTLCNVSTQISLRDHRRLVRADTFRIMGIEV